MNTKVAEESSSSDDNSFVIQDGQTVVFIGDSITDCNRRDVAAPLGDGYAKMVVDLITAKYPSRQINFLNKGIGGDVATGLRDRWADDVLTHNPDWVSVMVGINDLCTRFYPDTQAQVPPEKYREAYSQFLSRTREGTKATLVLMDPFYISKESAPNSLRTTVLGALGEYIAIVGEMAQKFDALHVATHDVFQRQLEYRPSDTFCPEPIHPNATGHMVIANAWLEALGW